MNTNVSIENQKTRLADWTDRREELLLQPKPSTFQSMQIKVLGYLIERYRDSPVAQVPARFAPTKPFYLNRRMIVVHEHLRLGHGKPTHNRESAERQIISSVHRMSDPSQVDERALLEFPLPRRPFRPGRTWMTTWRLLGALGCSDSMLRKAVTAYPVLPEVCLRKLASRLADTKKQDIAALVILGQCENESVPHLLLNVWKTRVLAAKSQDRVRDGIVTRISSERFREQSVQFLRECLGDESVNLRLAAIDLLAKIGNLDDISLFADILRLPPDDLPLNETQAILSAMESIAHRDDTRLA